MVDPKKLAAVESKLKALVGKVGKMETRRTGPEQRAYGDAAPTFNEADHPRGADGKFGSGGGGHAAVAAAAAHHAAEGARHRLAGGSNEGSAARSHEKASKHYAQAAEHYGAGREEEGAASHKEAEGHRRDAMNKERRHGLETNKGSFGGSGSSGKEPDPKPNVPYIGGDQKTTMPPKFVGGKLNTERPTHAAIETKANQLAEDLKSGKRTRGGFISGKSAAEEAAERNKPRAPNTPEQEARVKAFLAQHDKPAAAKPHETATKAANAASEKANASGTSEDHHAAAQAHEKARDAHTANRDVASGDKHTKAMGEHLQKRDAAKAPEPDNSHVERAHKDLHDAFRNTHGGRMGVQQDSPEPNGRGGHESSIRDWGKWHSDPQEPHDEDDDHQVLHEDSHKKAQQIIEGLQAKHPNVKMSYSPEEKNWLSLRTEPKAPAAKAAPSTEAKQATAARMAAEVMKKTGGPAAPKAEPAPHERAGNMAADATARANKSGSAMHHQDASFEHHYAAVAHRKAAEGATGEAATKLSQRADHHAQLSKLHSTTASQARAKEQEKAVNAPGRGRSRG